MASSFLKPSRLIAYALVIGAAVWILSGYLGSGHEEAAKEASEPAKEAVPIQKVAVQDIETQPHRRSVVLSCVTQADQRAQAVARGAGVLMELNVSRGDKVSAGQMIGAISDEGREASVKQAQALLDQRQSEYDSNKKLIDRGDAPRNSLAGLESGVAAAKAALAAAQAEADRSLVKAPVDGVVNTVPVQVGQAIQAGTEIAEIVGPDPMLAVGYATERQRGSLLIGQAATVRFIDGTTTDGIAELRRALRRAGNAHLPRGREIPEPGRKDRRRRHLRDERQARAAGCRASAPLGSRVLGRRATGSARRNRGQEGPVQAGRRRRRHAKHRLGQRPRRHHAGHRRRAGFREGRRPAAT